MSLLQSNACSPYHVECMCSSVYSLAQVLCAGMTALLHMPGSEVIPHLSIKKVEDLQLEDTGEMAVPVKDLLLVSIFAFSSTLLGDIH